MSLLIDDVAHFSPLTLTEARMKLGLWLFRKRLEHALYFGKGDEYDNLLATGVGFDSEKD